jgi:hypothetical protein
MHASFGSAMPSDAELCQISAIADERKYQLRRSVNVDQTVDCTPVDVGADTRRGGCEEPAKTSIELLRFLLTGQAALASRRSADSRVYL